MLRREVFQIFADTHRIIARHIAENVQKVYGLELNEKKISWGAVAPDILPKYKRVRHYQQESMQFIVNEIITLIYISRFLVLSRDLDSFANKIFSLRIGIISHYLSDYVCLPHLERWTFKDSMIKHVHYESKLNDLAQNFEWKANVIESKAINIFDNETINLRQLVSDYVHRVVDEYSNYEGMEYDLLFAANLSKEMTYFIIDTVNILSTRKSLGYSFVF